MITHSRCIAVLTTVVALSSVASAGAATKSQSPSAASHSRAARALVASRSRTGAGSVKPIKGGSSVAEISAFPTGGKGSGTEATCGLWSDRLQDDQNAQDGATDKQGTIDATRTLDADVNNALDAGCAVID
jgi:hypothetical protein